MQPSFYDDPEPDAQAQEVYRKAMQTLAGVPIPFLLGGAYAFSSYSGIRRHTKDLDVFLRRADLDRALSALGAAGFRTELTYPHWLAKAFAGEHFIDLIFNQGNGIGPVDDSWFAAAVAAEVLGMPVPICAAEEMIWSKVFTLDRGRYDGADVAHLLRARADQLDWPRLLGRFDRHWRVLLSHLILFGFIYPGERNRVPAWVLDDLLGRLHSERTAPPSGERLCQGTLLSATQYLVDVELWGYADARLAPRGGLTPEQRDIWTSGVLEGK
jgi:hypothetical protein